MTTVIDTAIERLLNLKTHMQNGSPRTDEHKKQTLELANDAAISVAVALSAARQTAQ